ncbi:MAG: CrtK [Rubritepida sp.]|nr:CrtK [Rubritepida sp.]
MSDWPSLIVFIGLCAAAASAGAFFRPGEWYVRLRKPSWNPPNWVFAPVWSMLYVMIAVAGWLVWRKEGLGAAMLVYAAQLVLNFLWSVLFFGRKRPDLALMDVITLWLSIVICILVFAPISGWAVLLMLPYLAWVTFAGALNLAILRLNSRRAG